MKENLCYSCKNAEKLNGKLEPANYFQCHAGEIFKDKNLMNNGKYKAEFIVTDCKNYKTNA